MLKLDNPFILVNGDYEEADAIFQGLVPVAFNRFNVGGHGGFPFGQSEALLDGQAILPPAAIFLTAMLHGRTKTGEVAFVFLNGADESLFFHFVGLEATFFRFCLDVLHFHGNPP
jgi:hypothetical protein